jgi:cephalosporin hydroxylase
MLLSVLIAARNEVYLQKTIENVLENFEGDSEIIAVCDGYWPDPAINDHPRVTLLHHTEPRGQRASINEAARIAKGKYVMKLDAHCAVDKGFDVKLAADCEYDWTVVPRMYNLDVATWTPKLHKRTDYMYIGWNDKKELRSLYYPHKEWKKWHHRTQEIDDTMGCMGPGWFMHKDRFWELGGCDENQGGKAGWGQQGIEVALKAWLSGGSLKVNKKTWFAHWFRGDVGFPYEISGREIDQTRKYSADFWLNNKWPLAKRDINWLLNKFNPPSWEQPMNINVDELNNLFYKHIHLRKVDCNWKGVRLIKMPTDVMLYHKVIWENKPDFIIDSGTKFGGSALFYQDMLDMVGNGGKVISIDKFPSEKVKDPRVTYIEDGSTSEATIKYIKETVGDKSVMVVLDSDHSRQHVKRELVAYSDIVTPGQYLVIEDCYMYKTGEAQLAGPGEARDWFLKRSRKLVQTDLDQQYLVGFCRGGWLLRK